MNKYLLFAFIFLASYCYSQDDSNLNPQYLKYLNKGLDKVAPKYGYIPSPINPNFNNYYNKKKSLKSFPAKFDLRATGNITSVKNQGECGSCWTFATVASIESAWKKQGFGANDLSENNIKNCHKYEWGACDGGNIAIATAYLARFSGPLTEANDSYYDSPQTCKSSIKPIAYVSDARYVPADPDALKTALMNHGALYIAYFHDDANFNSNNNTYYCSNADNPANHAVTLAGWDDDKNTAGGKGAWIVKNSWGTSWGENGYFYISYNDKTVFAENAYFPVRVNNKASTKIYTYSDLGWVRDWGFNNETAYAIIKFNTSDNNPLLKIGTWINTANAIVDINVYSNFDGKKPSGLLSSITSLNCEFPGYYTFDLPSPLNLNTGQAFYVMVKYYTPDNNSPIPVEAVLYSYANPSIVSGKCWISSNTNSWTPIGNNTNYKYDLCINAYTASDCVPPAVSISYTGPSTLCQSQTAILKATSGNGVKYKWFFNGNIIEGQTTSNYTASAAGEYYVAAENQDGCSQSSEKIILKYFSIENLPDTSVVCNDSIKLTPSVNYPTISAIKIYEPVSESFSNLGFASFGASMQNSFVQGRVVYIKDNSNTYTGCSEYPAGSLYNKIALIDRGGCYFSIKAYYAQLAGARAAIIINNVQGNSIITMSGADFQTQVNIPVVMISKMAGDSIRNIINTKGYASASLGFDGSKLKFVWTPSTGLSDPNILKPVANPKTPALYNLKIDNSSCIASENVFVDVSPIPVVNLGKDTAIDINESLILDAGNAFKYLWNNGSNNKTLTVNSSNTVPGNNIFSVTVTNNAGCFSIDTINVFLNTPSIKTISGKVIYNNDDKTPLAFAKVFLKNQHNIIIKSVNANSQGIFEIDSVLPGNYTLYAENNSNPLGFEPTDAYSINLKYLQLLNFTDNLKNSAADVNNDKKVNPLDALFVVKRYVLKIQTFPIGDWISEQINADINRDSQFDIRMICVGDVNASYNIVK